MCIFVEVATNVLLIKVHIKYMLIKVHTYYKYCSNRGQTRQLMMCTHIRLGDVLATVLALYMHDKQHPLPSHEEVLICTPETTTEEVITDERNTYTIISTS